MIVSNFFRHMNILRFQRMIGSSNNLRYNINITDKCAKQIEKIGENGKFLRVLVDSGGCSGFQYKFQLDDKINEDDLLFTKNNAQIVIDLTSVELLDGSSVDYKDELIGSSFQVVTNPKADSGCSCGSSFTSKS